MIEFMQDIGITKEIAVAFVIGWLFGLVNMLLAIKNEFIIRRKIN